MKSMVATVEQLAGQTPASLTLEQSDHRVPSQRLKSQFWENN